MYGKGRHRAGLNYGDCFSYALAKVSGQPLLFKGDGTHATLIFASCPQLEAKPISFGGQLIRSFGHY